MLQNRRKGTDFSLNNQKKTQKKSQTCYIFFDLDWLWNAEMPPVITKICQYWQLLVVRLVLVALNICHYWHFFYSGIPVKELYYLFLWQITSKLNLILIIADYQYIRQICIRILIVSASCQQITSKLDYARRGMRLHCKNDLFVQVTTPNTWQNYQIFTTNNKN